MLFLVSLRRLKQLGTGDYTCNSNYSGGRDQEHLGSKPAWANSSQDTILKTPNTKKGLAERLKL
jgi:hypothetical protein